MTHMTEIYNHMTEG